MSEDPPVFLKKLFEKSIFLTCLLEDIERVVGLQMVKVSSIFYIRLAGLEGGVVYVCRLGGSFRAY